MSKLTDKQFAVQVRKAAKAMLRGLEPNLWTAGGIHLRYPDAEQDRVDAAALKLVRALIKAAIHAA